MSEHAHPVSDPLFAILRDDDPTLVAAIIEAREKLARVKAAFTASQFRPAAFLVKVPFVDRSDIEQSSLVATSQVMAGNPKRPIAHLWLNVTSTLDDLFFCSVGEAPRQLRRREGESFVIHENVVEDWMINHQGVACGGFSLRVLRDRLGEIDKRKFDEHTGIHEFKQDVP